METVNLSKVQIYQKTKAERVEDFINSLKDGEAVRISELTTELGISEQTISRTAKKLGCRIAIEENGKKVPCICNPKTAAKYENNRPK